MSGLVVDRATRRNLFFGRTPFGNMKPGERVRIKEWAAARGFPVHPTDKWPHHPGIARRWRKA